MIRLLMDLFKHLGHLSPGPASRATLLFISLVLYSTSGYMYFELPENPALNWSDAFWWSIVTMTTVGYGDYFPATYWGRMLVGFPTMILGVGILGYILSLAASAILESKLQEVRGMKKIKTGGHIVICNFAKISKTLELIQELRRDKSTRDVEIAIIDNIIEELPPELQEAGITFVKGDPSRLSILEKGNVFESRGVVIQALIDDPVHSDNFNLKVALTIEKVAPTTRTVVECIDPENEEFFRRAGCDSIVCIAMLSGQMMVQELQDPGVGTVISELTSNTHGKQFYIMPLPTGYRNFQEVRTHLETLEMLLVGIRRKNENHLLPENNFHVQESDKAIVISAGRPAVP